MVDWYLGAPEKDEDPLCGPGVKKMTGGTKNDSCMDRVARIYRRICHWL